MKKIFVLVLTTLLCLSVVGCNTEKVEPNEKESNNVSIIYQSIDWGERVFLSRDWINTRLEMSKGYNQGFALCVVTVVDIDLTNVVGEDIEDYFRVPLYLKIDKIISKNSAFLLKENETVVTVDSASIWRKSGDSFKVGYGEGTIPITEKNAQYIVILVEDNPYENIDFDFVYCAESYTIPIVPNYTAGAVSDLYKTMRLPEDTRALSAELITEEFGSTYVPGL